LYEDLDGGTRADFELAEQLLNRALELAPLEGEVWAFHSLFCNNYYGVGLDRNPEREAEIKRGADRAIKLAPDSNEARYAWANCYRRYDAAKALSVMREVAAKMPEDRRVLRGLAACLGAMKQIDEALVVLDRAIALPGSDTRAWVNRAAIMRNLGRAAEEEAAIDSSLAVQPKARTLIRKALIQAARRGELDQAQRTLNQVPAEFLLEGKGTYVRAELALWQRQPARCLEILQTYPPDFIDDADSTDTYVGPKGLLAGFARYLDGKPDAARAEWQAALQVLEPRLATRRSSRPLISCQATLLAMTGQRNEAEKAVRIYEQLGGFNRGLLRIQVQVWLGDTDQALGALETADLTRIGLPSLRYDPIWEPLRGNPRFEALLKEPETAR
jgi:Flp pilus assembly protein TadD